MIYGLPSHHVHVLTAELSLSLLDMITVQPSENVSPDWKYLTRAGFASEDRGGRLVPAQLIGKVHYSTVYKEEILLPQTFIPVPGNLSRTLFLWQAIQTSMQFSMKNK